MSNFLSNLLTRTLGTAPVIQPRLPSLFEPASPHAFSLAAIAAAWDENRREAPGESAFDDPERGAAVPHEEPATDDRSWSEATTEPQLPPPWASERARDAVRRQPATDSASPFEGMHREAINAVRPALAHVSSPEEKLDSLSVPPSDSARDEWGLQRVWISKSPQRKLPASGPLDPATLNRAAAQPRAALRNKKENPERAWSDMLEVKADTPRTFHEIAESHAKSVSAEAAHFRIRDGAPLDAAAIEPPSARSFKFARQVPPPSLPSPPEPSIQVTIGRIEVRAVSPQASTPKERPTSPVMSLNDYLGQRSKRGSA